jgi:hypothetical protein
VAQSGASRHLEASKRLGSRRDRPEGSAASDYKNAGTGLIRFEDGYFEDDLLTIKLRALLKLPPP